MRQMLTITLATLLLAASAWGQPAGTPDCGAPPLRLDLTGAREEAAAGILRPASAERDAADLLSESAYPLAAAGTAALLLANERPQRRAGESAAWALGLTAAATRALKLTIDSPRPDHPEQDDGFPSGHTAISFAFARCVAEESDEWGAAAYAWAAGVAWSRVRQGDHDVPQVLGGALLGWWIADQVARERRPRRSVPEGD